MTLEELREFEKEMDAYGEEYTSKTAQGGEDTPPMIWTPEILSRSKSLSQSRLKVLMEVYLQVLDQKPYLPMVHS